MSFAHGLSFPDLPGCHSGADEDTDRLTNARQALDLWFEDRPMVEPSRIGRVRELADEDIKAGAHLLAIPYEPASRRAA